MTATLTPRSRQRWRLDRPPRYRRRMSGAAAHVTSGDDVGLVASLRAGDEQTFAALVDG